MGRATPLQTEIYVTLTKRNVCPTLKQKGEGRGFLLCRVISQLPSAQNISILWSGLFRSPSEISLFESSSIWSCAGVILALDWCVSLTFLKRNYNYRDPLYFKFHNLSFVSLVHLFTLDFIIQEKIIDLSYSCFRKVLWINKNALYWGKKRCTSFSWTYEVRNNLKRRK